MLTSRQVLFAKEEAMYGVDAAGTAVANSILVENIAWSNEGLRMNERPVIKNTYGKLAHIYGGTLRTITFDVELKGGGHTLSVVKTPELAPLLLACGMKGTASDTVFMPGSAGHKSVTLMYHMDGSAFVLTGARGTVSASLEAGAIPKLSFTLTGHYNQMSATALPDPTYNATLPKPVIDIDLSVKVGSAAALDLRATTVSVGLNTITFDVSNTVAMVPDMGSSDGYGEIQITSRDVMGSFDPESLVYLTSGHANLIFQDPMKLLQDNATFAITARIAESEVGSDIELSLPKCSIREVATGDREGVQTYDISFGCAETGVVGDDEFTLTFT